MNKQTFLKNLQTAPYTYELIQMWMDYFNDDDITPYLEGVEAAQNAWNRVRPLGCPEQEFIDRLFNFYIELPRVMVYPILLNMSEDIRGKFLSFQALEAMTHIEEGTYDVFDIH
jgi:hypothetical protein